MMIIIFTFFLTDLKRLVKFLVNKLFSDSLYYFNRQFLKV